MPARKTLDQFELGKILGTGTVGTVYQAHEREKDREVAVKILLPEVSQNQNIVSRFEREMLILAKLSHPNIIRYYGGGRGESDDRVARAHADSGAVDARRYERLRG